MTEDRDKINIGMPASGCMRASGMTARTGDALRLSLRRAWVPAFAGMTVLLGAFIVPNDCQAETVGIADYQIAGDAIPAPLAAKTGDAVRGRRIVLDRANGNCLICHKVPEPGESFQGDLGPDLAGVGGRLTPGQLRLRLVDQSRLNPATVMPPYHRIEGLVRVAQKWQGRPVLDAQALEDVVAYLAGLK